MQAIVFDFDGLILDTEWPAYITVAEVFQAHGREMTLQRWQQRIGRGDNGPWTDLLVAEVGDLDTAAIDRERRRRKNSLTEAQPVQPGVHAVLDAASQMNLVAGVASSSPMSWVAPHLERLGLLSRFHTVITRDHVERAKPWPDLFLRACGDMGADPARSLAFEDSVHGVASAKEAGMFCVAVPNRVTAGGDFSQADLVLDSLADLDLAEALARLG